MTVEDVRWPVPRKPRRAKLKGPRFIRPEVFSAALTDVIGQEALKTKLVSAFSQYTLFLDDASAGRPIVMVYGPSGTGKTFAIEMLTRAAGLPFTLANGAAISPPGVKGVTMREVMAQHWLEHRTSEGVIYVDEIDKWAGGNPSTEEGMFKRALQAELLRYLVSESVTFFDDAKDEERLEDVVFETKRTFWILSGAFTGLDAIVRKRLPGTFLQKEEMWENAILGDFTRFGLLEEMVNRIDTWAWTKPLTRRQIVDILRTQARPAWIRRFAAIGCELTLDEGAIGRCANTGFEMRSGVRGAFAILRRAMDDIYLEASKARAERVTVDAMSIQSGRVEFEAAS
jgi:ATP-dependent Clp protease ATP-binding subunit ClpX